MGGNWVLPSVCVGRGGVAVGWWCAVLFGVRGFVSDRVGIGFGIVKGAVCQPA